MATAGTETDEPVAFVQDYIANLTLLPEHMRHAMQEWIERGNQSYPPGYFLQAVLSNDLMGAVERADDENRRALPAYATYLYNYAPRGCYGSKERVASWRGLFGRVSA